MMSKPQIVVGIDGSRTAERAMLWAAAEASLRGVELLIVHAGDVGSGNQGTCPTEYGRALLVDAEVAVVDSNATCQVATLLVEEKPVRLLTRLSEHADLVVVGSHGMGRAAGTFFNSVAYPVAAHARCSVAIVPSAWEPAAHNRQPVVTGLSATYAGLSALSYAFTEAALRGVAVKAIRSWHRPEWGPELSAAVYEGDSGFTARQSERAELILRPLRDAHPDVEVVTVVTGEQIDDALRSASQDANLLVMGCRAPDGRRLSRLGRTTTRLAHQTACPLIAVGHQDLQASMAEAVASAAAVLQPER
jgi:nucleotide-binding universal stress UspA family protein